MTNLTNKFSQIRVLINTTLSNYLNPTDDLTNRVVEAMRYSAISEGKALRPFLIFEIGNLFNADKKALTVIACALEMIHTYSLIHDDLPAMDNDDMRRGKPSNHKQFDEATAILAGDGLLTKAFELLASPETPIAPIIKCQLISFLANSAGVNGMIGGQMIDLSGEKQILSENEIWQMQKLKTGALIKYACLAPAILVSANQKQYQSLEKYAEALGHLFQLTDDLLDIYGNTKLVGKTLNKDKKAQKSTYLALNGEAKTKEQMHNLVKQAEDALVIFGEQGKSLKDLIALILNREK